MSQDALTMADLVQAMKKLEAVNGGPLRPRFDPFQVTRETSLPLADEPAVPPLQMRVATYRASPGSFFLPIDPAPYNRQRITVDPSMVVVEPRNLTRWERVRVWFEGLVDRAELTPEVFPWRRVVRTVTRPSREVLVIGDRIICHPAVYETMKAVAGA